jgi:hypothetical protein
MNKQSAGAATALKIRSDQEDLLLQEIEKLKTFMVSINHDFSVDLKKIEQTVKA